MKYGQNFIENQKLIEVIGEMFDSVYADQLQMQITVNSSSYAVKFYESLGFSKTSEEQETDGLKYTTSEELKERLKEMSQSKARAEFVSRQYIHDLYRFFKLWSRRHEIHDIFEDTQIGRAHV